MSKLIWKTFIIVSAKGPLADNKTGLEAGVAFHLTRPVSCPGLRFALEEVVQ